MVILDAVHYSVRENGIVTKKAAYVAIGTDIKFQIPLISDFTQNFTHYP
jgi:NAD(P)H-flavin reductase